MTESTFKLLAISQFLYEVMIISLLHENSTLYVDMDFCISLGMGWSRILCYTCVTTLHDSYLHIESYPYVLLLSITKWLYNLIYQIIFYRIPICRRYHGRCFMLIFLWPCVWTVLLYMAGPHVKQPLADESWSTVNIMPLWVALYLQRSDAVARIPANGSTAFNGSCTPIG